MGYLIQLEAYQGPFDLLLDLVVKNKVEIWEIPIASITEQYLQYLASLQEQNLAITGEFLVMAATLIRIKARLLLPKEAEEEQEEEEDPRIQLVQQLLRYKFFKEVAQLLQEHHRAASQYYFRGQKVLEHDVSPIYTDLVGEFSLAALGAIYQGLIREAEKQPPVHSVISPVSVEAQLALVRLRLIKEPRLSFRRLLDSGCSREIVVTFLAILELIRLGEVRAVQNEFLGEIEIIAEIINQEVSP